jgi:protein AroM
MDKKIGIITIGQSPRTDVVPEMTPFFGDHTEVLEVGALDGLTLAQVKAFRPEAGMTHLASRMRDGTEILIAKEKILPRIERAVNELNQKNVSLILLFCVGVFPVFPSRCLIVEPQRIVDHCVESLISEKDHLGILIPIPEQETWVRDTFVSITPRITVTDASPYSDPKSIDRAGRVLREADCDLIVMYCMGFNQQLANKIRQLTGKPVILSSSLVARVLGELTA